MKHRKGRDWVMDEDLSGIFHSDDQYGSAREWYEEHREMIINPQYRYYGAKLVSTRKVRRCLAFKLKILFRPSEWYLKPYFGYKYLRMLHWLFWMLWIEIEYDDVQDRVIKDYLKEENEKNK